MGPVGVEVKLRKFYYRAYCTLNTASTWIKSIYSPLKPMDETHISPVILALRKYSSELDTIANELENYLAKRKELTNASKTES